VSYAVRPAKITTDAGEITNPTRFDRRKRLTMPAMMTPMRPKKRNEAQFERSFVLTVP
jgi:hypothetical protein